MNRLKELRTGKGLSQVEMAQKFCVSQGTYSLWENDKVKIDNESLSKLADFFGVSVDYLLGREEIHLPFYKQVKNTFPVARQRIRMLGKIACGTPIYADEDRESYVVAGTEIDADFCLMANGDSMVNARILDGDIVFCREQNMVENGEIAAVIIGDEATLKRVFYYPEKKKLVLQAENPKYEPLVYVNEELDEIRIIGKAIAFQSDVR